MRIEFPRYENGQKHWNNEIYNVDFDENSYCKTIEDVNKIIEEYIDIKSNDPKANKELKLKHMLHLFKHLDDLIEDLKITANTTKTPKFINTAYTMAKKGYNCNDYLDDYPQKVREHYAEEANKLYKAIDDVWKKNVKFVKDNKDDVIELLNRQKLNYIDKAKQKRKEYNIAYRNKLIQLKMIKPRDTILTDEERREHRKLTNQKYYLKRKEKLKNAEEEL